MLVLLHASFWAHLVAYGEVLVGLGLIFGVLTGIAAFFGSLMNVNYLLAGTVSSNPILFVLGTWLVLAWRVAGWYGVDRWLPALARHAVGAQPIADTHTPAFIHPSAQYLRAFP